jgi:hypothetical protein
VVSSISEILIATKELHRAPLSFAPRKGRYVPLQPVEAIPQVSFALPKFPDFVLAAVHYISSEPDRKNVPAL